MSPVDDTDEGQGSADVDGDEVDGVDFEEIEEIEEVEEVEAVDGGITYDCTVWAGESRGMLASLLDSRGIRHAWQGTTLSVLAVDEELVDELVEEVLASARPALDPAAEKIVYEVGGWPAVLQTMLADSLTVADLPYEWDERGDLVVYAEHEEEVEAILDEMPDPDDPDYVGEISADDGVAVHELLDRLFAASRKLASKDDTASILAVDETVGVLERMGPPFGFEPSQWSAVVSRAVVLRDALAAGPDDDAALDDDELRDAAATVRDLLREYL